MKRTPIRSPWRLAFTFACVLSTQCSPPPESGQEADSTGDLAASYELYVSTSASRSGAVPLLGASLAHATAYVFTSDASRSSTPAGVRQVRYWLDNPQMSGTPAHVENYAAYDFAGTAPDGSAFAWDTSKVSAGNHTITQSVTTTAGSVQTWSATFTVGAASDAGACKPTTCAAQGKNCGTIPDGCGGTLTCGTCTSPATCGGTGTANVCGTANMKHYWVATTGSDANDGSQAHPWATINHADQALTLGQAGTVVHVAPGTYGAANYTKKVGTATQRVRFQSDVRWGAKITALWSVQGAYQELVGFEMTAPGAGGMIACYTGVDNNTTGHHCRILGNYIHDVGTGICSSAGAINTAVVAGHGEPTTDAGRGYNEVIGNVIRHVGADAGAPNHCNQFHGIYLSGPFDVAQNNIISGVIGWGIHARGDVKAQVMSNNTIFNNSHGGIILEGIGPIYPTSDYATVSNNIVVDNGLAGASPSYGINDYDDVLGTHNLYTNNLLYGNLPSNWAMGKTSTSGSIGCADPCKDAHMVTGTNATVFVNFQSDWNTAPAASFNPANYELRAASPAIDRASKACTAGGLSPCTPAIDFLGVARPQGAALDIGVFESGASASPWPWY
jgi:Protein of unknown function (DUF1565)